MEAKYHTIILKYNKVQRLVTRYPKVWYIFKGERAQLFSFYINK